VAQLTGRRKALDFLVYLAVSICIVLLITWYAMHAARIGGPSELPLKWLGFIAFSLLAFGYPARNFRRFWGRREFWFVFLGLMAAHLGITIPLLMKTGEMSLVSYALGAVLESSLIVGCLSWALSRTTDR
jgi:hypothetical protein